jgi:hypothetical protein
MMNKVYVVLETYVHGAYDAGADRWRLVTNNYDEAVHKLTELILPFFSGEMMKNDQRNYLLMEIDAEDRSYTLLLSGEDVGPPIVLMPEAAPTNVIDPKQKGGRA